jgi:hypothetical protein
LFPDPLYSAPELLREYGCERSQGGIGVLSYVLDKAVVNLMFYRWDDDVCIATARLLLMLSKRSRTQHSFASLASVVHRLPQWPQLLQCFLHNPTSVASSGTEPASFAVQLSATAKRYLVQAIIQFADSNESESFSNITEPIRVLLHQVFQSGAECIKHPEVMSQALNCIEVRSARWRVSAGCSHMCGVIWPSTDDDAAGGWCLVCHRSWVVSQQQVPIAVEATLESTSN